MRIGICSARVLVARFPVVGRVSQGSIRFRTQATPTVVELSTPGVPVAAVTKLTMRTAKDVSWKVQWKLLCDHPRNHNGCVAARFHIQSNLSTCGCCGNSPTQMKRKERTPSKGRL